MSGILYIVATPLGNLSDVSQRTLETLKSVDFIAAEDTRHSKKLLSHFQIIKPMVSVHEQNERWVTKELLTRLEQGESMALISDAGTPLISDPGYHLVNKARETNIRVIPIPGPCAAIVALSASGLASNRFVFEGFLSAKKSQRIYRLQELQYETRTLICYESPHRMMDTLLDMQTVFGGKRYVVIARELTKIHETIQGNFLKDLIIWLEGNPEQQKGEFVILVQGCQEVRAEISLTLEAVLKPLLLIMPLKKAVEITAEITGERKNKIYQLSLKLTQTNI